MIDLSRDGYTHDQVRDMLHGLSGSRQVRFRYLLLDKNENVIKELKTVESASVEQASFSSIKRTAKFTLREEAETNINWFTDRIAPFIEFKMPDIYTQNEEYINQYAFITPNQPVAYVWRRLFEEEKEGTWLSFPLGIFLLSSPTKKEEGYRVYREIEAYDKTLIVKEDKIIDRLTFKKGSKYYNAMVSVLTGAEVKNYNIENDGKTIPNDKEYAPGTEKLEILNDLASDLNFTPIWVDEFGYFRSSKYYSPQELPEDYVYEDEAESITLNGSEEELDTFDLPNVFIVTVTNPDTESVLTSTFVNDSPDHPRSTVNLGRRVVRHEEKNDIADQNALNAYVERLAQEASQLFGKVVFSTALMPFHGYSNVLYIKNKTLGINDKYAETSWTMPLRAGADMSHEVRKVVSLT